MLSVGVFPAKQTNVGIEAQNINLNLLIKIICYIVEHLKIDHSKKTQMIFFIWVFTKQWPLAPNSPKWRITRANVYRLVTFFSKMANVECERMYRVRENGWRMSGECIESGENGWRMSGECIESGQSRVANVGASKIGRFMHK